MLDDIKSPEDLRGYDATELRQIADELRSETVRSVAVTGGHLGSGLGVVELTAAWRHVFDTPRDRLIWDVGHPAYPHEIPTGRRDRIHTLRAGGGLSGFTTRAESEYDPFGAAHAATSISAALVTQGARGLRDQRHNVVAVIRDGSLSAGTAHEAMNNAGASNTRLIVILNDDDISLYGRVELMLVVGAKNSSNSNRLHEIGLETGVRSHFIADSGELRSEWFDNVKSVGVTAGASAPELLVEGVVNWLRRLGPVEVSTLNGPDETIEFRLPPELASVSSLPRLPTAMARPLSQG